MVSLMTAAPPAAPLFSTGWSLGLARPARAAWTALAACCACPATLRWAGRSQQRRALLLRVRLAQHRQRCCCCPCTRSTRWWWSTPRQCWRACGRTPRPPSQQCCTASSQPMHPGPAWAACCPAPLAPLLWPTPPLRRCTPWCGRWLGACCSCWAPLGRQGRQRLAPPPAAPSPQWSPSACRPPPSTTPWSWLPCAAPWWPAASMPPGQPPAGRTAWPWRSQRCSLPPAQPGRSRQRWAVAVAVAVAAGGRHWACRQWCWCRRRSWCGASCPGQARALLQRRWAWAWAQGAQGPLLRQQLPPLPPQPCPPLQPSWPWRPGQSSCSCAMTRMPRLGVAAVAAAAAAVVAAAVAVAAAVVVAAAVAAAAAASRRRRMPRQLLQRSQCCTFSPLAPLALPRASPSALGSGCETWTRQTLRCLQRQCPCTPPAGALTR